MARYELTELSGGRSSRCCGTSHAACLGLMVPGVERQLLDFAIRLTMGRSVRALRTSDNGLQPLQSMAESRRWDKLMDASIAAHRGGGRYPANLRDACQTGQRRRHGGIRAKAGGGGNRIS